MTVAVELVAVVVVAVVFGGGLAVNDSSNWIQFKIAVCKGSGIVSGDLRYPYAREYKQTVHQHCRITPIK